MSEYIISPTDNYTESRPEHGIHVADISRSTRGDQPRTESDKRPPRELCPISGKVCFSIGFSLCCFCFFLQCTVVFERKNKLLFLSHRFLGFPL